MFADSAYSHFRSLGLVVSAAEYIFDDEQRDLAEQAGFHGIFCPIFLHMLTLVGEKTHPLLQQLWELRSQKCTVPHDRIYAVWSMRRLVDTKIDYTIPAWKAFRELAFVCIKESDSLLVLAACLLSENRVPNYPSRVPDWSIDIRERPTSGIASWISEDAQTSVEQVLSVKIPRFCVSGKRKPELTSISNRKLIARGVLLNMVMCVCPSWSELAILGQQFSKFDSAGAVSKT